MALRGATESTGTSDFTAGLGTRTAPVPSDIPLHCTQAAGDARPRARRRLVDALMDAGRLRAILTAGSGPRYPGGGVLAFGAEGVSAADFIGIALTFVARRPASALTRPLPDTPWPQTPALDALSALFLTMESGRAQPTAGSLAYGGPAVQRELEQLGRLAALPPAGFAAVTGAAPGIAAMLAEFAGQAPGAGCRWGDSGILAYDEKRAATTVGPGGDNQADAVVLTRLLLRRCRNQPGPEGGVVPIYPAADDGLFRAIGRWRAARLPARWRRSVEAGLRGPVAFWDAETRELATLARDSSAWKDLRRQAGCENLRLRVIGGTAVILVDRRPGEVREAVRRAAADFADRGAILAPQLCAALMAAALAFYGATGQALVCRAFDGAVLRMSVDVDWIDPMGRPRSDRDSVDAIADAAPLAALRLLDAARAALSDYPTYWRLTNDRGHNDARQLVIRLAPAMLTSTQGRPQATSDRHQRRRFS